MCDAQHYLTSPYNAQEYSIYLQFGPRVQDVDLPLRSLQSHGCGLWRRGEPGVRVKRDRIQQITNSELPKKHNNLCQVQRPSDRQVARVLVYLCTATFYTWQWCKFVGINL